MTWTVVTTTLTCTVSDSIAGAVGVGSSNVTELSARHKVYRIDSMDVVINAGVTWKDTNAIIIHERAATTGVIGWANATTSHLEFGDGDLTDEDKPILSNGCHYMKDERADGTPGGYGWHPTSGGSEQGNFRMYGGVFENNEIHGTGATGTPAGDFHYMPSGEVNFIGVNWVKWGGCRFNGTNFRIQEVKMMGSGRLGCSVLNTADPVGIRDLIIMDGRQGYYFSSFQTGATTFRNTAVRNAPMECTGLTQNCEIIDSDAVDALFSNIGTTSVTVQEKTSYNATVLASAAQPLAAGAPTAGDPLDDTEYRFVRTESRTSDAGGWSTSNLEIATGNTPANGQTTEALFVRKQWNNGETVVQGDSYRGFFAIYRQYGFQFEHLPRFPAPGAGNGIVDTILLRPNTFVATAEATVSALTGIALDEGNSEIDLTSSHTIQEIYDWLQWYLAQPAQMNFRATGDAWLGTGRTSPLNTNDGNLFTVETGWTITGQENIVNDGKILQLANGDRYTTIELFDIPDQASWEIRRVDNNALLYAGTGTPSGLFSVQNFYTGTPIDVKIRVRLQGYKWLNKTAQINSAGLSVSAAMRIEKNFKVGKGRLQQKHFRFRNDDGSESTATWKAAEDTDITGQATAQNFRLRFQIEETTGKPDEIQPRIQFRPVGDDAWFNCDDA